MPASTMVDIKIDDFFQIKKKRRASVGVTTVYVAMLSDQPAAVDDF